MQIFVNTNYDFLKWRFKAIAFSILFCLVGFAMFFVRGGVPLGIDFAGGANVVLKFQDNVSIDQLRKVVPHATIQQYGKAEQRTFQLRVPQQKAEGDLAGSIVTRVNKSLNGDLGSRLDLNLQGRDALAELLKSTDPDKRGSNTEAHNYYYELAQRIMARRTELGGVFTNFQQVASTPGLTSAASFVLQQQTSLGKFAVLSQETVGPHVGKDLQSKAFWAIVLSTLAMGLYITLRFDLKFGAGAVTALIHDVLIGLAFMGMINAEFNLIMVAAFLMIVGYSINDTVVVYDRVRENMKKSKTRESFETVLNHTLNQTLSRTILTSGSVVLVLIALIIFGGKVINEFSWVLLIGVLAGTYSTVTIAPALVIAWNNRSANKGSAAPLKSAPVREEPPAESRPRKRAKA
jgi:preprotein translocase subunit SecF